MSDKFPGGLVTAAAPAGYSVAFDGSGDYIVSSSSVSNVLGAGDFTIEFWMLPINTSSAYRALVSSENYSATTGGWSLYQNGTAIEFWLSPGGSVTLNATSAVVANTWQHLALCRASGTLRLFVNGVQAQSVSNSTSLTGQQFWIGGNNSGSFFFNGYMSNVRVVIGTALYTTTFTPPTQLFRSSIAGSSPSWNASLLACNSPTIIDQSSSNLTFTVFGNSAVSTFSPFPSSYYFYNAPTDGNTRNMVPSNIAGFNPAYGAAAPGVWTLDQAQYFTANRLWPIYDPYFNLTTLLLPGNQPSGVTDTNNNVFKDSSTNNFSITRNGNTTQGTFSPFSQTGWSVNFRGGANTDAVNTSSAVALTGDFALECWVYQAAAATTYTVFAGHGAGTTQFVIDQTSGGASTGAVSFYQGSWIASSSAGVFTRNVWNHVALTRSGTTVRIFVNGSQVASGTLSGTVNFSQFGSIGTNYTLNGYISNLRITSGAALYTSTFTPSTTPLTTSAGAGTVVLLTCQANRFVDASATQTMTITSAPSVQPFSPFAPTAAYSAATVGGSGYFDGNGDYLSTPDNNAFDLGTGDFTFECWLYKPNNNDASMICGAGNGNLEFAYVSGSLRWGQFNVIWDTTQLYTIPSNAWTHIALTRVSGRLYFFANGTLLNAGGTANTGSYNVTTTVFFGVAGDTTSRILTGYMAGVRLIKGQGLATASFTPPTAPVTATTVGWTGAASSITGTVSVLLNFTNAAIIDATSDNVLETVGNAQISTAQSKWGGSSMSFDGSGDCLTAPWNPMINVGSSTTWTIEFWGYVGAAFGTYCPASMNQNGTIRWGLEMGASATNVVFSNATAVSFTHPSTLSINTWFHFALVRDGTTVRLYINGVASSTTSTNNLSSVASGTQLFIGRNNVAGFLFDWNGYMDDFRITTGFARYTANFVPPTSALQLQ